MPRMTEKDFEQIISGFYEAAAEPDRWAPALARVTDCFNAWATHLFVWDNASRTMPLSVVGGDVDPEAERLYGTHYGAIDPRRPLADHIPIGTLAVCHRRFDSSYVRTSEFYQDFLIPYGGRFLAVARLGEHGMENTVIGFMRGERYGAYERSDLEALNKLLPHLKRASDIHRELSALRGISAASAKALEQASIGISVVDANGRAIWANRTLTALADQNDGLSLTRYGVRLSDRLADASLQRLLKASRLSGGQREAVSGGTLTASRPSGRKPLLVAVTPVPQWVSAGSMRSAWAVIMVRDPETSTAPDILALQTLFGLTEREAELASALVKGNSLAGSASALGISYETARAHLRSIFDKTNTSRQAELVLLLTRCGG